MYRLPSIIVSFMMFTSIFGQSPHGDKLKVDCNQCHNPSGWEIDVYLIQFEHNKKTDFILEGAHTQTDCKACHTSLDFNKALNQCSSCHEDIHSASVGNDCMRCHSSNTWLVDNIPEIHEENGFPLIGSHGSLNCIDCHTSETNLRFDNIGNECISCHQDDYLATKNPNHSDTNFSTNCLECHNPIGIGWTPANVGSHDFFPLTLGHDIQDCTECHTTTNYADADPNCVSCHQNDYDATSNPNHNNVGFSNDCVSCHTTNPGWTPATINHDFFPLTLGHDIQDCTECHTTTNYADADPNCVSCHQNDYDATSNPNHNNVGFSNDCVSCHTTNPGWTPATINHDFFPLTLGHDIQDCTECHTTTNYADADPNCVSCHQNDYDATSNPNHNNAGFSNDCVSCHTTNPGWTPATINHDFFPLTLGHDIQDCNECHTTTNYADADPNCVSCHQNDYDNANNPNHQAANFPTDCIACHTTNPNWIPATFNHDGQYFPIDSGKHQGEWNDCLDCHFNPNDYSIFNCLNCHEHNDQNQVDNDHDHPGEPEFDGYVYESNACLMCHPNP